MTVCGPNNHSHCHLTSVHLLPPCYLALPSLLPCPAFPLLFPLAMPCPLSPSSPSSPLLSSSLLFPLLFPLLSLPSVSSPLLFPLFSLPSVSSPSLSFPPSHRFPPSIPTSIPLCLPPLPYFADVELSYHDTILFTVSTLYGLCTLCSMSSDNVFIYHSVTVGIACP